MTTELAGSTLHIGKGWFPEETGGLDRYYYELMTQLDRAGVASRGLVTGSRNVSIDSCGRVNAFAPTASGLLARCRAVRDATRQELGAEQVALVAAHFALYAAPCLDLIRDTPMVVHFQGPWAAESRVEGGRALAVRFKAGLERAVYGRARRCITLSKAFADILHRDYGVPVDRIVTIPGGVDVDHWDCGLTRDEARVTLGWPLDRPIVFAVRRLARRMGLEQLIESIPAAVHSVPDLLVQVAGKGPLAAELQRRRNAARLGHHLTLLGYLPDALLPVAYRAANLTVVPSVALEGFGLVAVESLASGTPVLVSNVGGLAETVSALAPQSVVHRNTAAGWGEAIVGVFSGALELPDAAACVRFAREQFDWSVVIPRILATYREAMA